MGLATQAKESAWWQSASEVSGTFSTLIGLEAAASSIESFQLAAMPGLLQTPDWARATLGRIRTRGDMTPEQIEEFVRAVAGVVHLMHTSSSFWTEALGLARRVANPPAKSPLPQVNPAARAKKMPTSGSAITRCWEAGRIA